ncbi:MAG: hypothetical protein ACREFR_12035 [Limisphaerales bacterium]
MSASTVPARKYIWLSVKNGKTTFRRLPAIFQINKNEKCEAEKRIRRNAAKIWFPPFRRRSAEIAPPGTGKGGFRQWHLRTVTCSIFIASRHASNTPQNHRFVKLSVLKNAGCDF